ncbi:hypothetical protein [Kibdelosporangium aridum]|uniref:Uncharacterized protein n=1 Tax=Kibdelosporangium aridum TaxID=2030 RepID=A0A1W2FZF2_KIBAR|nr:hypothetical protein [Kibdelosporangium aridum]SMD27320.1 hypothetical protein SAMN05661093_10923 [Kibdelosporangium aridum]
MKSLRHTFDGTLITSDDQRYDTARKVWNSDVVRHPAVIARPGAAFALRLNQRIP